MQTLITIMLPLAFLMTFAACDGSSSRGGGDQDQDQDKGSDTKSRPTTGPSAAAVGQSPSADPGGSRR